MNEFVVDRSVNETIRSLFGAVDFAAYKHRYQKRKGLRPVPYINHPISVTKHLIDNMEEAALEVLQAAILHDTLEDTKTTYQELQEKFGEKVASIVNELTDDMSLPSGIRKKKQVEHAKSLSYEAGCIKIADKYCNIHDILNTLIGWPRLRKIQYTEWGIAVVKEIPNRHKGLENSFVGLIKDAGKLLKKDFEIDFK